MPCKLTYKGFCRRHFRLSVFMWKYILMADPRGTCWTAPEHSNAKGCVRIKPRQTECLVKCTCTSAEMYPVMLRLFCLCNDDHDTPPYVPRAIIATLYQCLHPRSPLLVEGQPSPRRSSGPSQKDGQGCPW